MQFYICKNKICSIHTWRDNLTWSVLDITLTDPVAKGKLDHSLLTTFTMLYLISHWLHTIPSHKCQKEIWNNSVHLALNYLKQLIHSSNPNIRELNVAVYTVEFKIQRVQNSKSSKLKEFKLDKVQKSKSSKT